MSKKLIPDNVYKPKMVFSDRVDEVDLVFKTINTEVSLRPNVVVFHGNGGTGKTRLSEKIRAEIAKTDNICTGLITLETFSTFDVEKILLALRQDLGENSQIEFPAFDAGYLKYMELIHPEIQFQKIKKKKWFGNNDNSIFDLLDLAFSSTEYLDDLSSVVPGLKIAVNGLKKFIDHRDKNFALRTRPTLKKLYSLEADNAVKMMLDYLPILLADDINYHLIQNSSTDLVIILDEYEKIWDKPESGQTHPKHPVDKALINLVSSLNNVLLLVFKRHKLAWANYIDYTNLVIEQHEVLGLPVEHAMLVLKKDGIESEEIIQGIINSGINADRTRVHTDLLEKAIIHYHKIKEQGIEPQASDFLLKAKTFEGKVIEINERYLKDVAPEHRDIIKRVAVARYFGPNELEAIYPKKDSVEIRGIMRELEQFDFIKKAEDISTDHLRLDNKLRETTLAGLNEKDRIELHKWLFDHFDKQSEDVYLSEKKAYLGKIQTARFDLTDIYGEDVSLTRFTFADISPNTHVFAFNYQERFNLFNGSSEPILLMNLELKFNLEESQISDYLKFIFRIFNLYICEKPQDIDWLQNDESLQTEIGNVLKTVEIQKDNIEGNAEDNSEVERYAVKTTIVSGSNLHLLELHVLSNGWVIEQNSTVLHTNLPVRTNISQNERIKERIAVRKKLNLLTLPPISLKFKPWKIEGDVLNDFLKQLPTISLKLPKSYIHAVTEALYHLAEFNPKEVLSWWGKIKDRLYEIEDNASLILILEKVIDIVETLDDVPKSVHNGLVIELASLLNRQYEKSRAETQYRKLLQILENPPDNSEEQYFYVLASCGLVSALIDQEKLDDVGGILEKASNLVFIENESDSKLNFERDVKKYLRPTFGRSAEERLNSAAWIRRSQAELARKIEDYFVAQKYYQDYLGCELELNLTNSYRASVANHELSKNLREIGRVVEAEAIQIQALEICREFQGDESRNTWVSFNTLAETLFSQNRFESAYILTSFAKEKIASNISFANHAWLSGGKLTEGKIFRELGRYEEAEKLLREALREIEEKYGVDHSQVASAKKNLAKLLVSTKKFDEAEKLFKESLKLLAEKNVPYKAQIGRLQNRYAELMIETGRNNEAASLLLQARSNLEEIYGLDNLQLAKCLTNFARLADNIGKTEEAKKHRERVEEIYRASIYNLQLEFNDLKDNSDEYQTNLLEKICVFPLEPINLGNVEIKSADLSGIYGAEVELLRFTFKDTSPKIHKFALKYRNEFDILDGKSAFIHKMNKDLMLNLNKNQVIPYLRLFLEIILGGMGYQFRLHEKIEDVDWRKDADSKQKQEVEKLLIPLKVKKDTTKLVEEDPKLNCERYFVKATVIYEGSLFTADFRVWANGFVQMLQDELLIKGLAVANQMRIPKSE